MASRLTRILTASGRQQIRERLYAWWWWRSVNRPHVVDETYIRLLDQLPADALGLDLGSRSRIRKSAITLDMAVVPGVDVMGDAHQLPFDDDTFDYVWCNAVLEHVPYPMRVAAEIGRILKPGALAFIQVPFLENVHGWPDDYYRFTLRGLRVLFNDLEEVASGVSAGPGQVLPDLVQYYSVGFAELQKGGLLVNLCCMIPGFLLIPIRMLDRLLKDRPSYWKWARAYYWVGRKPAARGVKHDRQSIARQATGALASGGRRPAAARADGDLAVCQVDFATALWNQRESLRAADDQLRRLQSAVNRPGDLPYSKWLGLYAFCLEFGPDLIIELGRGFGNSTCVFTEVANRQRAAGKATRVVSIGYDSEEAWRTITAPRLQSIVSPDWFRPLSVLQQHIQQARLADLVASGRDVFVFWDAHGRDLAAYLLAELMPALRGTRHVVTVDDIGDARHSTVDPAYVGGPGHPAIWYGPLVSAFDEVMVLGDFCARNGIAVDTPGESIHRELGSDRKKREELEKTWGVELARSALDAAGGWIYFALHDRETQDRPLVFPTYAALRPLDPPEVGQRAEHQSARGFRRLLDTLVGRRAPES